MFPMHGGFMGKKKGDVGLPFIFTVTVGSGQSFQLPTVSSGTYDALIDWGDTTSNTLSVWDAAGSSHTYTTGGTYEIRISGVFNGWRVANYADRLKITEIKQWGILQVFSTSAFQGASNMIITATDFPDFSSCTSFLQMFAGCASITSVSNIQMWDVSGVTNFQFAFSGCTLFDSDLSGWDTSNVQTMREMFLDASSFNGDISGWDVSKCTSFLYMFRRASSFNSDISAWNLSASPVTLFGMFQECPTFNQDISGWNTSSVTSFERLFRLASAFDQNLGLWQVSSVVSFSLMFSLNSLSQVNYDSLLVGWASQVVQANRNFNAGSSKYTPGGAAEAARDTLITTYGWTITDGGPA